jgi:hypothetical protein
MSPASPITPRSAFAVASAAFVAGVTLTTPAHAIDPVVGFWNGPDDFGYSVQWMPDIDQRWFTLPNDGAMYCVPTAAMNMLAFASHWGDELLQPGPGVWDDNYVTEQWDLADKLEQLGFLMETSPTGGTGVSGLFTGLDLWIGQRPFDVWVQGRTETDYPTLSDVASNGVAGGGTLAAVAYGRYIWDTVGGSTPRLLERTGGHMVTVRYASAQDGVETLMVRDPSTSDTIIEQSPYSTRTFGSTLTRLIINDANGNGAFSQAVATTLGVTGSGRMQVLDCVANIVPCFAGGFQGGDVVFGPVGGINGFTGGGQGGIDQVALPPGSVPLDLAIDRGTRGAVVLFQNADGQTVLARAIPGTPTPEPIGVWDDTDIVHVMVDRHGRILALGGRTLYQVQPAVPGGPPAALDALLVINHLAGPAVLDDANDRMLILAPEGPMATMLDLTSPQDPQPIALLLPAVQAAREAARRSGAAAFDDDRFFVVDRTDGGDRILAVKIPTGGEPETQEVVPAVAGRRFDGLSVDRRGHLVGTAEGGGVKVFAEGPGGFDPIDDDWYAQVGGLEGLALSRSRTNFLPGLHDGPGWENIDPSELEEGDVVLDCFADIDQDGQVGLGDLLRVLAGWGGEGVADIMPQPGGDGVIDFADLLEVLSAWGPCD